MKKYRTIKENGKIIPIFDVPLDDDPENSDWLQKRRELELKKTDEKEKREEKKPEKKNK